MKSKKNMISTPDAGVVPVPTVNKTASSKWSPTLDVRSNVLNLFSQYPTTILDTVPSNKILPDSTNYPVDPTKGFKTIVSYIIESLPLLISPIYYEPKTVLLQRGDIKQELINASAAYKTSVPYPNKTLLLTINIQLKILAGHLQDYQT